MEGFPSQCDFVIVHSGLRAGFRDLVQHLNLRATFRELMQNMNIVQHSRFGEHHEDSKKFQASVQNPDSMQRLSTLILISSPYETPDLFSSR